MDPLMFLTFLALVLFGVVAVKAPKLAASVRRKKAEALTDWAERNGWQYQAQRPELVDLFTGTPFRGRGDARHVLTGSHRGFRVLQYEYGYIASPTSGRYAYRITAVETPHVMPVLDVEDSRVRRAIMDLLGVHTLRLDDEEFDGVFRVATGDDDFARAVLTEEVRSWLAGLPPEARHPFRFTGHHVICWEGGPVGHELDARAVGFLADLCDRLPSEVWERPWRG